MWNEDTQRLGIGGTAIRCQQSLGLESQTWAYAMVLWSIVIAYTQDIRLKIGLLIL